MAIISKTLENYKSHCFEPVENDMRQYSLALAQSQTPSPFTP